MNVATIRILIAVISSIGITACGFKLAGTANFAPELSSIYLQSSGFSDRQRDALRLQLTRAGAELVNQDDSNAVVLTVTLKVLAGRRLVTSASNGKTVERIARSLDYGLKSADGEILAPTKTLLQQNDIVLDDDNLLASDREKTNVLRDLEQTLFEQLIRQLKRI